MKRCLQCVMPDQRPDTPFINGVCQACINYSNRPVVDWHQRDKELVDLLDRHHGEVIVPSSGGKDSLYQAIKLKQMGAHVTAVTARTCHLTPIGRANLDNMARHVKTIEVVPNMTVAAKLNRIGLEMVGDISWREHVAIFTTPFNVAADLRIELMFYGENPQDQYGGPLGSEQARQMTARWRSEFGGFLGLRPADMVGQEGITARDMLDYQLMDRGRPIEAHFLGAYIPWDSHHNAEVAREAGMVCLQGKDEIGHYTTPPCAANRWVWENLDNAQTGLHDYLMYRKYGYGRGCAQASVDIRSGRTTRKQALAWVEEYDGTFPEHYMGVSMDDIIDRIGISRGRLAALIDRFTNWEIHPLP